MFFTQTLINVITSKNVSIYTVHNFFPGKGHESIDLPNSSKILQKSNCKNRNLSKGIRGEFQFHLSISVSVSISCWKKIQINPNEKTLPEVNV